MIRALAILIDDNGKTIGARLVNNKNEIIDVSTQKLKEHTDEKIENAVIDSNGYLRAKKGNLPKIIKKNKPNTIEHAEMQKVQKLLGQGTITIYHGNKDKNMIPTYGVGEENNDYGRGFYTTPDIESGKEWAMSAYTSGSTGYLHTYEINTAGLKILDLTALDSLYWIAELLAHRTVNTNGRVALEDNIRKFIKKYKLNTSEYDIIIGYRADDSYFMYAQEFVIGNIYKENMEKALRCGKLGIQVFIKSKKAFSMLKKAAEPEIVPEKYMQKYKNSRKIADEEYRRLRNEIQYTKKKQKITDFI